jgi:hypothetical protein
LGDGITQAVRRWDHRIRKTLPRDIARDLSGLVGELPSMKGVATHWLTGPGHEALRRLQAALAMAEAAYVAARWRPCPKGLSIGTVGPDLVHLY